MSGELDLARLLQTLEPQLHAERYSFSVATDSTLKESQFAIVREDEGLTAIGRDPDGEWARISLGVHSSLDAVGLTAALSTRLTGLGISANIVAGRFHDYLFVPWDRREEALESLRSI